VFQLANHKKREAAEATGAFGKMSRKKFEKELAKLQVELVRVTPALGFARTQGVLDGRHAKKHRRVKHDFAFSGLIACGHCGCSIVGEIKKQRYVYL
jgi:hypothetical protein